REASDLVLVDDAYQEIVGAVEGGRGLASQLRRAVAFYLGAKLALVTVITVALALGLAAPFQPVHLVVLELFMDIGASIAFVSEPTAPDTMERPPRDPARRFLDRTQLAAIGLTAGALVVAVLPTFLIVHAEWGTGMARAAAVAAWLIANTAIGWNLRGRVLARNLAFPVWGLTALAAGLVLSLTGIGAALGVKVLNLEALAITVGIAAAGVVSAAVGRVVLSLRASL
ncbi:MAG: cation-translocating P-type ATPase, partial [Solirubrobacterales bacterium]|nr:cation-translocating P-type ATPase [Solirubrobacterales bacterium]